jgi:hypothetical protein
VAHVLVGEPVSASPEHALTVTHGDGDHVSQVATKGLALLVEIEQSAFARRKGVRVADVHITLRCGPSFC